MTKEREYAVVRVAQNGRMLVEGAFPREDDARLAAVMYGKAMVVEVPPNTYQNLGDFGHFENSVAGEAEYGEFTREFLAECYPNHGVGQEWTEKMEEDFMQWWYRQPEVRGY